MPQSIDFYFDFASPYGYFASHRVDAVAARHGRSVAWKPIMLGPVFRESGNRPLAEQPLKGAYCLQDWERLARLYRVAWQLPEPFPVAALAPARAFWWLVDDSPGEAKELARAVFQAYFGDGRDISQPAEVARLAEDLGLDAEGLLDAIASPEVKQRLKDETAAAMDRGVCGSPFFIVDGEGFWGSDRLDMVDDWLARGGW